MKHMNSLRVYGFPRFTFLTLNTGFFGINRQTQNILRNKKLNHFLKNKFYFNSEVAAYQLK